MNRMNLPPNLNAMMNDVLKLISNQIGVDYVEVTYIENEFLIKIKSIGKADKISKIKKEKGK